MMTLEQIGQLAVLWYEAEADAAERVAQRRPFVMAVERRNRREKALRAAIRDYKLLEKAKGKSGV